MTSHVTVLKRPLTAIFFTCSGILIRKQANRRFRQCRKITGLNAFEPMVNKMTPVSGAMSQRANAIQDQLEITQVQIHGEWFNIALHDAVQENFWKNISTWEPSTLSFVETYAKPGATFIDIGAWIGPITLLAARRGARVVSLEPDPAAFSALRQNLLPNNLTAELICAAIHTDDNELVLNEGPAGFGDSMSSSLNFANGQKITIPSIIASQLMERVSKDQKEVVFKIDIEGHEYVIGGNIAQIGRTLLNSGVKVSLNLSVHPKLLRRTWRGRYFLGSRSIVRRETRRLLTTFGPESSFVCNDGVPRSIRKTVSRFVPAWPRKIRSFSVVLA